MQATRFPIRPCIDVALEAGAEQRIAALAGRLIRQRPSHFSTAAFGPRVACGLGSGPAVLIGDQSEIPLHGPPETGALQYRIAHLAGEGDVLAIAGERCEPFEAYLARLLGLPALHVMTVPPTGNGASPVARRCAENPGIRRRLAADARRAGHLAVMPHLTTGHAWNLARVVAGESGARVCVAGPPPRLSRMVNDKLWFADRVRELLGRPSLPPTCAAWGPASLTHRVLMLARRSDLVVVKLPDSSGSAGNLTIQARTIRDLAPAQARDRLLALLAAIGWSGAYPLLVEVWESPVVANPSVQLWIPRPDEGPPVVEGLFEQVIEGLEGEFIGAVPAQLPQAWRRRLAGEALLIARLFQHLGYFGRCSFDAIVAGADLARAELHWIECNGRWGGVSVPMTLANRLSGCGPVLQPVVVQRARFALQKRPFATLLADFSDMLFQPGGREGVVFLTPFCFERGTGIHFMALAATLERARALAARTQARLRDGG